MLVLHAHWIAPRRPQEAGGVLFWAEDSAGQQPTYHHGRLPQKPRLKPHPFQAPIETLKDILRKPSAARDTVFLSLPSSRTGPLPSPQLAHNWTLDRDIPPFLAPYLISGVYFPPQDAFPLLLDLPMIERRSRNLA